VTAESLPVGHDPDDERTWFCIFCGKQLGDIYPFLYGEVAWAGGEYAEFSAHPVCFEAAVDQSIRDEGYFDSVTHLPVSKLPGIPAGAVNDFVVVAEFRPPDARALYRRWRSANSELLNELPRESVRVEARRTGDGESFTISLAPDLASRARPG
jgi:hypothetical protein